MMISEKSFMAIVHTHNYDRLIDDKFEGDDQLLYYAIDNIINMLRFESIDLLSFRSSVNKNEQILFIGYPIDPHLTNALFGPENWSSEYRKV